MTTTVDGMIEQITQNIFATMLNIELVRIEDSSSAESGALVAAVQIAGEWMGSVVLRLSASLARSSAASMLQIPQEEVNDTDQNDVAGELANMVGGNLKSVLPGPSFLSLPTIITGQEFGVQVHDARLVDEVVLASTDGILRIQLYSQAVEGIKGHR